MLKILAPYRQLQNIFHFHTKVEVLCLVFFDFIMSILELCTVTAIIPLVMIIVSPETALHNRFLNPLYRMSGLQSTEHFAILLAVILLLTMAVKAILAIFTWKYEFHVLSRWRIKLSTMCFDAIIKTRHEVISKKGSSGLVNILSSSAPYVVSHYLQNLMALCQQLTMGLFFILFSLSINLTATTISATFGVSLILLFVYLQRKKVRDLGEKNQEMSRVLFSVLQMSIFGMKETKIALKEDRFAKKFYQFARQSSELSMKLDFVQKLPSIMVEFIALSTIILTFIALILFSYNTKSAAIQISILVFLGMRLIPIANRSIVALTMINSSMYPAKMLLDFYNDMVPETNTSNIDAPPLAFKQAIILKNISYRYNKEAQHNILNDINFSIPKGSHVGIVGPSGAGKSTLVNLILGFLDEYEGEFKIDDTVIGRNNLTALRKIISFVDQQPFFLASSYIDNIAYGEDEKEIDLNLVRDSLERVGLLAHAVNSKDGLNTNVGENGKFLSGGQRQRLAIARALYKNAKILILDEASSALDMDSEAKLSQLIESLKGEITIISIAHRLSTLKTCDKVFFMDKGEISAEGNFTLLYHNHTDFKRYVDQSNIEINR